MYKIEWKLEVIKWVQENQKNSDFVYKMMVSETADTA